MSLIVKGFVTDATFISNVQNEVASVFELSSKAYSYAKDKTHYSLNAYPGNDLVVFKAINQVTGDAFVLDNGTVDIIFRLTNLIKAYPINHVFPYVTQDYLDYLQANIGAEAVNIGIGEFEQFQTSFYPKWFSFNTTDTEVKNVIIYISNGDFLISYDEYEIQVVPPLADSTLFNRHYGEVLVDLEEETFVKLNDRMELAKGVYPNTYTKVMEFTFHNKLNPTVFKKVYWGVIIYGEAGNDIDAIKDAIEEYILSNPGNIRSQWEIMFPDIFRRTEFLLFPLWHKVAVENLTDLSNIYSSMIGIKEAKEFVHAAVSDLYSEVEIYNDLVLFPYDYKAITIAAIPGTLNIDNKDQLFEIFNDYIPVNTSSLDYMRMSTGTRDWSYKLEQALLLAETDNIHASVTPGFRKVTRGNRRYVAFYYDNINYLVAYSYNTFYP